MEKWITVLANLLVALTVSSCVVPAAYGPYYRPVYPQAERVGTPTLKSAVAPIAAPFKKPDTGENISNSVVLGPLEDVWIAGTPAQRLRFRHGNCFIGVRADKIKGDFVLDWTLEKTTGCNNQVRVEQSPVTIEDMDAGKTYSPTVYSRSLLVHEAGIPVENGIDLSNSIPGFKKVPEAEKKYLVSISFTKYFNGDLPSQISIEFPTILLNEQKIKPPRLLMDRQDEFMSRFSHYIPKDAKDVTSQPFESQYRQSFEVPGQLAIASVFWGWQDGKKWGEYYTSGIRGVIRFYVHSGSQMRLEMPYLTWSTPEKPEHVEIPIKRFNLIEYSTTRYDDQLEGVFLGDDPSELYRGVGVKPDGPLPIPKPIRPYEDTWITPLVRIPNFHPKRVKVILPKILVDGIEWKIKPIIFQYQEGSLELIDAM